MSNGREPGCGKEGMTSGQGQVEPLLPGERFAVLSCKGGEDGRGFVHGVREQDHPDCREGHESRLRVLISEHLRSAPHARLGIVDLVLMRINRVVGNAPDSRARIQRQHSRPVARTCDGRPAKHGTPCEREAHSDLRPVRVALQQWIDGHRDQSGASEDDAGSDASVLTCTC